jgi:hypothetical protein
VDECKTLIDGYDPDAAVQATEVRREQREERGLAVRQRHAENLRARAARETREEAITRRKATAADRELRESQQRKLLTVVALHARIKHAWREVLIIRTVHKIHIGRARACRTIQRHWRGYIQRRLFHRTRRALMIIQPRVKLWVRRRLLRTGASFILEFLEGIAAGNNVIHRLHALRRACAVIQNAFRSAFRTTADQNQTFLLHWSLYERYVHMQRAEAKRRKAGAYTRHFSAQLEPCLSQENTLHTLNTP